MRCISSPSSLDGRCRDLVRVPRAAGGLTTLRGSRRPETSSDTAVTRAVEARAATPTSIDTCHGAKPRNDLVATDLQKSRPVRSWRRDDGLTRGTEVDITVDGRGAPPARILNASSSRDNVLRVRGATRNVNHRGFLESMRVNKHVKGPRHQHIDSPFPTTTTP